MRWSFIFAAPLLIFLTGMPLARVAAQHAATTAPASGAGRPNIIFILADDLGYGDPGCYGQSKIQTPNIDRLAAAGMRFTQFYAGTTVCAPSRASLMTGLHTGHTPVRGNREFKPEGQFPLPDSSVTIATALQREGYVTADFGKWGLGYPGSSGVPTKQGFSTFFGYNCQAKAHNYYPDHLWQNDQRVELTANLTGDSIYSADLIHEKAMEFLRGRAGGEVHLLGPGETLGGGMPMTSDAGRGLVDAKPFVSDAKPFFLFLSYTLPHAALSVPHDSVYQYYVHRFNEPPLDRATTKPYEKAAFEPYPHAAYAAMVSRLDSYVGDIVREVERQGIAGNTLILFSSDNGPHREGGNDPDFFYSNGGLRGIKRDLYEGGIRVPFIASWKGKIKAGSSTDYPGAFWDLYPTFLQLADTTATAGAVSAGKTNAHMLHSRPGASCGKPADENGGVSTATAVAGLDGVSLWPLLSGKPKSQLQHDYLYWEFHENGGSQAVRWRQWKAVRVGVTKDIMAPIELYDLDKDPGEKLDLAAKHPDIVKKMRMYMGQAHRPDKNWPLLPGE